jgi:hypothetical protein
MPRERKPRLKKRDRGCSCDCRAYFLRMKAFHPSLLVVLIALCGVTASEVHAQMPNQLKQSESAWKGMDNCKRQAWKQNPDYTHEGNAKRDEAMRLCLQTNHAPPISPLDPRENVTGSSQR